MNFGAKKTHRTKLEGLQYQSHEMNTLPETNIAPENGSLEYDPFLLGFGLFPGAFAVSFREGNSVGLVSFRPTKDKEGGPTIPNGP